MLLVKENYYFKPCNLLLLLLKMPVHLVQSELCRVQIKQCFTYETLQRISANLGQSILNLASI